MQYTGSNNPSECALYYPELVMVRCQGKKKYRKVCCITVQEREKLYPYDICGTTDCPFFKPVGKEDWIRKENGNAVWFEQMSPEQQDKMMTAKEYETYYAMKEAIWKWEKMVNEKRAEKETE